MTGKKEVQRDHITIYRNDLTRYNSSPLDPRGPHTLINPYLQSYYCRNEIVDYLGIKRKASH